MTNVHSRHIRRGTVGAPVVTIDHAEAARLQRERSAAFWGSGVGAVMTLLLVVGVPLGIAALVGAASWGPTGAWVLPLAVVVAVGLIGWAMFRSDS